MSCGVPQGLVSSPPYWSVSPPQYYALWYICVKFHRWKYAAFITILHYPRCLLKKSVLLWNVIEWTTCYSYTLSPSVKLNISRDYGKTVWETSCSGVNVFEFKKKYRVCWYECLCKWTEVEMFNQTVASRMNNVVWKYLKTSANSFI